jgi:intraflagellar transport protein 46
MNADEAIDVGDDNEFDLDESDEQQDHELQDNGEQDYDQQPSDEEEEFGEANKDMQDFGLNEGQDDEPEDEEPEEDSDEFDDQHQEQEQPKFPQSSGFKQPESDTEIVDNAKKVENQAHDMEFELDDSEEIDTEEDGDKVDQAETANHDVGTEGAGVGDVEGQDYNEEAPEGAYNAADYANLNVTADVRELFEYIGRYKPQKIDLESTFRPFIPDYMPHVGEVDAFIKMPKPDKTSETVGIEILDEPNINTTDKATLEMKYIQKKKTTKRVEMEVHSIENPEKNPKEIQRWIQSVNELNQSRPPATVQYTKPMPDFDNLMEEWPASMEGVLKEIEFPGPELEVSTQDYARIISMILDIPVHAGKNNKGVIEAMHVMFTLYSDFKENQHFQNKAGEGNEAELAQTEQF